MCRELINHKLLGSDDVIKVNVLDSPGFGGACHTYEIDFGQGKCDIYFQNGPIKEYGNNGINEESILAIVEDRLSCFQAGTHSCRENAIALTKIQEAMMWLQRRTKNRILKGTEGTNAI